MDCFMDDFHLESSNPYLSESKREVDRKKSKKNQQKELCSLQMFKLECDLQKIIQDDEEQSYQSQSDESDESDSQDSSEQERRIEQYRTNHTSWLGKNKSKDCSFRDIEQQKQTTIDISIVDYTQSIERFSKNPKTQIIKEIKDIENKSQLLDDQQKKNILKQFLEQYLLQYEVFCYQQSWKDMNDSFKINVQTIIAGIQQTFSKKIGSLPFQQRRVKLLKYLEKKKKRIWRKKVSYDCRKKVADGRLRIKGKFVTREQACEQLGLESLDNYSPEQIKQMLQRRMDNSLTQQQLC